MPINTLLLDADQFAYRAAFASEKVHDWGNDTITKVCDKQELRMAINNLVEQARADTGLDKVLFGVSSAVNFRDSIWPDYKGNRDPRKKPIGLKSALAYIKDTFPTIGHPRLEADDVLGVCASHWKTSVLWANDKDFLTVPCSLYRSTPKVSTLMEITEEQADKHLMLQTLTGDTTDNYEGIRGVGPAKAEKYLDSAGYTWIAVADCFIQNGYTFDYFVRMAKLARICRNIGDWCRWFPLSYSMRELNTNLNKEEF